MWGVEAKTERTLIPTRLGSPAEGGCFPSPPYQYHFCLLISRQGSSRKQGQCQAGSASAGNALSGPVALGHSSYLPPDCSLERPRGYLSSDHEPQTPCRAGTQDLEAAVAVALRGTEEKSVSGVVYMCFKEEDLQSVCLRIWLSAYVVSERSVYTSYILSISHIHAYDSCVPV